MSKHQLDTDLCWLSDVQKRFIRDINDISFEVDVGGAEAHP